MHYFYSIASRLDLKSYYCSPIASVYSLAKHAFTGAHVCTAEDIYVGELAGCYEGV
jgi:hypothetical protein